MTPPLLTPEGFALLERIHGHIAVLSLAVLLHPVLTLGRRTLTRGARYSLALAAILVTATFSIGWVIYPSYRVAVKPGLIDHHRGLALAFETKEHLAMFCLVLTWGGVVAAWSGAHRPARACLSVAWLCGVAVAAIGITVAATAHPGWLTP